MMLPNRKGIWLLILLLGCSGCQHPVGGGGAEGPASDGPLMGAGSHNSAGIAGKTVGVHRRGEMGRLPPAQPAANLPGPVILASYRAEEVEGISENSDRDPTGSEPLPAPPSPAGSLPAAEPLSLEDVVRSVYSSYPLLEAEIRQRLVAEGEALSAWGPYDLNVEAYGIAAPEGFYENYRHGVALKQALYQGGYVYGGYRIGRGDIQPWYKERLTDEGGEFKLGFGVPLLQNRHIDKYRSEILQTSLARDAVEPQIRSQLLGFVLAASEAYWTWVAAGQASQAQLQMLRLATERADQIELRVRRGDIERIALLDNQRLIASREMKLIETQRKFQAAAIKLSLFLRDAAGSPRVAPAGRLPLEFPDLSRVNAEFVEEDVALAQSTRPELLVLDLLAEQMRVELAAAENQLLPLFDARLESSKDVGVPADEKGDKTPLELEAGLWGELPLQRREAHGMIRSIQGKLAQIAAKRRFTADKVAAEVRDAVSALATAVERIERARVNARLAQQSLDLGRQAFEAGDLTVVTLNIYEQAVLDARVQQIEAEADYFTALAAYRAATGNASPFPSAMAPDGTARSISNSAS